MQQKAMGWHMSRNLLFISKYKDIIEEFLNAMRDENIAIDTAQNGIEAVSLLRKREYQVVVTGLAMDGYNGEQLITYINKSFPNTVCIIYTTTISAAQLHFFVNKRNVFRVFLRPVDFKQEFMEALEEAYEYYEIKVKDKEEEANRKELIKMYQVNTLKIQQVLENQEQLRYAMTEYMKRITALSLKEYTSKLQSESQKRLSAFEMGMVEMCCKGGGKQAENIERAEEAVVHIAEIAKMQ